MLYKNLGCGQFAVMHDMVGLIMHFDPQCAFLSALPIFCIRSSRRGHFFLSALLAVYELPVYGSDDWHIFNQHNSIPIIAYHHHHIMPSISGAALASHSATILINFVRAFVQCEIKLFICLASQNYHPLFSDKCAPTHQDLASAVSACAAEGFGYSKDPRGEDGAGLKEKRRGLR